MNKVQLNGGCLCGAVRYEASGDPSASSYCHCDDCKRATGGPYTVGVLVEERDLKILCGSVKGHTVQADSGRDITRQFCPECGSPLFTRAEACPGQVFVKAGSLDDPSVVSPRCETWVGRAVSWAHIDNDLPRYEDNGE